MKRLPPWISIPFILAAVLLHGCDQPANKAVVKSGPPAPPTAPPPPPTAAPVPPTAAVPPGAPATVPSGNTPSTPVAETPPPAGNTETVKAGVGVGIKGRSLDDYEGALVTPAKAYFAVRERAVFEIRIPHALQLYKAENGRAPANHAEFIEKIVQANAIQLPALPPGHIYQFNPETEELLVVRPKRNVAP